MNKVSLTTGIFIFGISSLTHAQPSERIKNAFDAMDTNGDGNISFQEFQDNGKNPVERLDANGDNLVSLEEFLNGRSNGIRNGRGRISEGRPHLEKDKAGEFAINAKERALARFEELDAGGDGLLSSSEIKEATIERLDSDGDGHLSAEEVLASLSEGPRRGPGRNRRGPPPLTEEQLTEIKANMQRIASDRFAEIDLDGNGLLSELELKEASFLQLDKDGNGVITLDELKPRPRNYR